MCPPHEGPRPLATPPPKGTGISYRAAVEAIEAALPAGANVVSDAGNSSASVLHYLRVPAGGRFIVAHGMGAMGHSFGAALGAAFANRRRTYVLAGDGAFYMHGLELHTAIEHRLPVTFVLFNNNAHAMCSTREQLYYGGSYTYNVFQPARLAAGTGAMFPGLPARQAATAAELGAALLETNAAPGPALVNVDFDADEFPPFVPFLEQHERLARQKERESAP
jgi:acetolactate synthase-1/2/3 large subunit